MEARSSSKQAFERIFDAYAADVAAYLRRRVSRDVADEVLAETFLVAWRRVEDIPVRPLPWLLGIAHRTLANQLRGRRRQAALVGRLRDVARSAREQSLGESEAVGVLEALQRLRPNDREVLMLTAWEGLRAAEAAEVLGCSEGAFRARLHRARARMERLLADNREGTSVHSAIEDAP